MNSDLLYQLIVLIISLSLMVWVRKLIFSVERREPIVKPLLISLTLLIFFSFIPAVIIAGNRFSIFQLILSGSIPYAITLIGYVISFALLLGKNPNYDYLAGITYFIGFIASWVGLLSPPMPKDFDSQDFLQVGWIILYYVIGIAINLFYLGLIFRPTGREKKRTGVWKLVDDWGTNRRLLKDISTKFGLQFDEESGWKQAKAIGKIGEHDIEISGEKWVYGFGYSVGPVAVNKILLTVKGLDSPPTLISKRGLGSFLLANPLKTEYLGKYNKLLQTSIDGLKINTATENLVFYRKAISHILQDLDNILSKDQYLNSGWIVMDEDKIWYGRRYGFFGVGLTESEMEKIIQLLIKMSKALSQP